MKANPQAVAMELRAGGGGAAHDNQRGCARGSTGSTGCTGRARGLDLLAFPVAEWRGSLMWRARDLH